MLDLQILRLNPWVVLMRAWGKSLLFGLRGDQEIICIKVLQVP